MTPLDRLRQALELLPGGASITLPREALLEVLGGPVGVPSATPPGDLTVPEVADRFRRSPSTIRSWLETGRFPEAYKLNSRDWRVPLAAVEEFENQQRGKRSPTEVDLSGWRKYQKRT